MIRNWKSLELAALLAAAFTAQPVVFAGEGDGKKEKPVDAKAVLDELRAMDKGIRETFKKFGKSLDNLKEGYLQTNVELDNVVIRVKNLEKSLANLQADVDKMKPSSNPIDKAGLDEIRTKLEKIEQSLAKMQGMSRIALSPPNTGRIQLMNMYPEELLFVINGKNYRVEPNRTMFLENHPAGSFTYEVIAPRVYGSIVRKTVSLDPNETFTITAR